jgi:hypothetical protein
LQKIAKQVRPEAASLLRNFTPSGLTVTAPSPTTYCAPGLNSGAAEKTLLRTAPKANIWRTFGESSALGTVQVGGPGVRCSREAREKRHEYKLTFTVTIKGQDDPVARKQAKDISEAIIEIVENADVKLQQVYMNRTPRNVRMD